MSREITKQVHVKEFRETAEKALKAILNRKSEMMNNLNEEFDQASKKYEKAPFYKKIFLIKPSWDYCNHTNNFYWEKIGINELYLKLISNLKNIIDLDDSDTITIPISIYNNIVDWSKE
jgi:hypothetical protein